MQALPAANPVTPSVPANVANSKGADGGAPAVASDSAEQPAPATFEQVLASQLDAETLRPDLILEAANTDWDEDPSADAAALMAQDPAQVLQLPQVTVTPTAGPAGNAPDADGLELQAQAGLAATTAAGTAREPVSHDIGADAGILEAAALSKPLSGKGRETDPGLGAPATLESGAQSQPLHGTHEAQRTQAPLRAVEGPAFNPRAIPEPVRSPQWSEALGQRVVWMAKENVQVVYLQVEPPNLGPLEVQLRMTNDQANLTFSSAHASVRDAISGSLPKLDELLSAGGVSLGSVSVNTQSPSQDPRQQQGNHNAQTPAAGWEIDPQTGEASRPARPLVIGLVDTFA